MIQVKGSDTMINLVQILAEEYMTKTPRPSLRSWAADRARALPP